MELRRNSENLDPFPTPCDSINPVFMKTALSSYDSLLPLVALRARQIVPFVRSQEKIVILDLFSGEGYIPLYLLYWLAKNGAISPESLIEINTITLNGSPKYQKENMGDVISGTFIQSDSKWNAERDNSLLTDGTLTPGLLSRTTAYHYIGNVFELVQCIPNEAITLLTVFACREVFTDPDIYFRRLPLPNGDLRGEIDREGMKNDLLLAQAIRNTHFTRILQPGGFFIQNAE